MKRKLFTFLAALCAFTLNLRAWDYEGHHAVNELALVSLPKEFGIQTDPGIEKIASPFWAGNPIAGGT